MTTSLLIQSSSTAARRGNDRRLALFTFASSGATVGSVVSKRLVGVRRLQILQPPAQRRQFRGADPDRFRFLLHRGLMRPSDGRMAGDRTAFEGIAVHDDDLRLEQIGSERTPGASAAARQCGHRPMSTTPTVKRQFKDAGCP